MKIGNIFLVVVLLLWLIPLGVFVAQQKQKVFCGGQRAICLCLKTKEHRNGQVVTGWKTCQNTVEQSVNNGYGHQTFLPLVVYHLLNNFLAIQVISQPVINGFNFHPPIEVVPRLYPLKNIG